MYRRRNGTIGVDRLSDNAIIGPENKEDWAEYQAWLAEGNLPLMPETEPVFVPQEIAIWQLRLTLANRNLFAQAEAVIQSMNNAALTTLWEYGNTVKRNSSALDTLMSALDLSSDDVDEIFIEASGLNV